MCTYKPFDKTTRRIALDCCALLLATTLAIVGCGKGDRPPLGKVSGVVTLDGQPIAGVGVLFTQSGYRSSSGLTDERGKYKLQYLKDVPGATIGKHQVRLQYVRGEESSNRPRLAKKYNRESTLSAVVERGRNEVNFDLESQ